MTKKIKMKINMFSYIFCLIYLFFCISFIFLDFNKSLNMQIELNNLMNHVDYINKYVEENKLISNTTQEKKPANFKNGTEALIHSYKELYEANSFFVNISGTMIVSLDSLGVSLSAAIIDNAIKFNNDYYYNELLIKLTNMKVPQMFEEKVSKGIAYGSRSVRKNRNLYDCVTREVELVNGIPVGNYSGKEYTNNNLKAILPENLLIINDETILKNTYFKVKYKNDEPDFYYVQVELDPEKAPLNFKNIFEIELGNNIKFFPPNHTKCVLTASINSKGQLVGLTSTNTCKFPINIPIIGYHEFNTEYTIKYVISGINQEINFVPEGF